MCFQIDHYHKLLLNTNYFNLGNVFRKGLAAGLWLKGGFEGGGDVAVNPSPWTEFFYDIYIV